MNYNFEFKFGQPLQDLYSGFRGVVDSVVEWHNGSIQYSLNARCGEDGKMSEAHWLDVASLAPVQRPDDGSEIPLRDIKPIFKFKMEDKIKHKFTPFVGFITGRGFWANGCARYRVTGEKLEEGKPITVWFDEAELELEAKFAKQLEKEASKVPYSPHMRTGGPSSPSKIFS